MARKLFTNARVVTPGEVFLGTIELHAGRIVRVELGATDLPGAEDCGGDFLLPGLVDLRATRIPADAPIPALRRAIVATDLEWASAGITTVCHQIRFASGVAATSLLDTLTAATGSGDLRADHWWNLELPGAFPPWPRSTLESTRVRCLSIDAGGADPTLLQSPWLAWARERRVIVITRNLRDDDAVRRSAEAGAVLCEQSRSLAVARAVTRYGMHLALASDVAASADETRARSASVVFARHRAVDCFMAHRSPLSLLQVPFVLRDIFGWPLPVGVAAVAGHPAELAGFADRGSIAVGRRADLVRVRDRGGIPVPVATWRAGERIA